MAVVIGSIIVSAAIHALTKEDAPEDSPLDDTPTPTAKHGTFLPLLFGRRRVASLFAWVGDRQTRHSRSSGGGKGSVFGGGSASTTKVYERAWHVLCIGPAAALTRIYSNGALLHDSPLTPASHPSGTAVPYPENSSFKPYWGESDQPIDPLVADKVAASRFPGLCSVVWSGDFGMYLGSGTTWPSVEYELEARVADSTLKGSPSWLTESAVDEGDEGVNPAHALWQLLTQPFPRGAGLSEDRVDMGALERLGELCAEEHIPMNVLVRGGNPIANVVALILTDLSIMLPQVGEILTVVPIRQDDSPVNLTEDLILPSLPETVFKHGRTRADRIIFTYKDQRNGYKEQDLIVDDDGSADVYGVPKTRKVALRLPTHPTVAAVVADRRQQEELIDRAAVTLRATRAARTLIPGQAFVVPGVGQLRLLSSKIDDQTNAVVLEAIVDHYAPVTSGYEPPKPDINVPNYAAEEDWSFTFFEFPAAVKKELAVGVFRIRGNATIVQSNIWLSGNGTSYNSGYLQNASMPGGELTEEFSIEEDFIVESGPVMDDQSGEIPLVLNLTGDDENWRLGKQLLILEDEVSGEHEILFIRNVTALGGDSYRLDGLIRARYDTQRRTFPIGTKVYIFQWNQIEVIEDPLLIKDIDLYVKSQPGTNRQLVDVSTVAPVSKTIVGRGVRPLPTGNFRANDDGSHPVDEYGTGGDVFFEWTYRVKDGAGAAAGEQRAGVPVTGVPPHDGVFKVEIIDPAGPTVVRTFEIDSDTTQQNYTNSQLVADFSGEPATFDARVTNVEGAYVSDDQEITIVKV